MNIFEIYNFLEKTNIWMLIGKIRRINNLREAILSFQNKDLKTKVLNWK